MPKVLFISKQRQNAYGVSYGLLNSCIFVSNTLNKLGIEAKSVSVVDNNSIDREVAQYKPTHVFVEALWVVPEKFTVLIPLHPTVQWFVRLHSHTSFIANEGIAMQWIMGYEDIRKKLGHPVISPNSEGLCFDLKITREIPTVYSPNIYYPMDYGDVGPYDLVPIDHSPEVLNVGCFGAIRPMKNQLIQAVACMGFANETNKTLHFHINATRLEQNGDQPYRNLKYLFAGTKHKLVEHGWCNHPTFLSLVKEMDLGIQVSFSETFNIVAADFVSNNIPLVGSPEIDWLSRWYKAKPTDAKDILRCLHVAEFGRKFGLQRLNKAGLEFHNYQAIAAWRKLLFP